MITKENDGHLKITLSQEEYAQLAAADLTGNEKLMTRLRTYGTCRASLTVDWTKDGKDVD